MYEKFFELLNNLTDNDTLIIIFAFILAQQNPEFTELIAGGLLGYMGHAVKKAIS
jgi:hypothetical protein